MIEWTDSRIDLLKKCVAQSMSASQAAAVIGGGISRNGAIGKARRLGLKFTSRYQPIKAEKIARRTARGVVPFVPSAVRQVKRIEKMARMGPYRFAMHAQDIIVEPVQPVPATAVSTAVSIPATAVSIFELTARTCRWPLWGPDTPAAQKLYCGAERVKPPGGSWDKMNACPPYCAHHCAEAKK